MLKIPEAFLQSSNRNAKTELLTTYRGGQI